MTYESIESNARTEFERWFRINHAESGSNFFTMDRIENGYLDPAVDSDWDDFLYQWFEMEEDKL